jgi:predicted ATPase/class 3 adenylate cyclase
VAPTLGTLRELPTGTVTFLFTDIEGSTRLLQELGDRYAAALTEHRRALRDAFGRHGGVEVDTQGDALLYAFSSAAAAVAAAAEGQRRLSGGPVRVRMGIHTGEPATTEGGYVGTDVHRGARIAGVAHGGQIVVSSTTRALVNSTVLRDLGEHRLKDLTAPVRLFQLGDEEFPPLKSLNATNLPVAASTLVGRERELADLQGLLRDARLVTLTGPRGSGKTRLGLQVAAELLEQFPGGVFFVPLAGVAHPELAPSTIATTIGVRALSELREREALLILDKFEHVLEAAPAIGSLLARAPETSVLATSRAPLRLDGEREYPLAPLADDEALALLTERARAVRPDFRPDATARAICRRLDSLPLALELAASRLRSLSAATLLERLDRRLPLLTGVRRDAPERQRTLRATIEWSYDLLSPEQQLLFRRLSVFSGDFSLAAAEAICDAELDLLDALVEQSLVKPAGADRFVMLETIRELAFERLEESGEAEDVRLRHAEHFAVLALAANLNQEADGCSRHDVVVPERDNIRAALDWTIATGRAELGLRLATRLENYWVTTNPEEGKRWIEGLLHAGNVPAELHALAIRCLGNSAVIVGDKAAEKLYEQSLAEFRALGDEKRIAVGLHRLAAQADIRGKTERARRLILESVELFDKIGFRKGEAGAVALLGNLELRAGRPDGALERYERSLALARETGFTWWEKNALLRSAEACFPLERPSEAAVRAARALEVAQRIGDRWGTIDALAFIARAATEQDHSELAGVIWGGIEAEVERAPLTGWNRYAEGMAAPIFARAGREFEEGRARGRILSLNDVVAAALEGARS